MGYLPHVLIGIFILVGIIVIFLVFYFIRTYNNLVSFRNKVRNQKSQIDIELKRRFDLVPNLIETVKGYAGHEKSIMDNVLEARNSYVSGSGNTSKALDADTALNGALTKLFALTESYPDLKANQNFLKMQNDLGEIEKRIVFARQFYNDSVNMLNNKIEMFPSSFVAKTFKFTSETFFEAKEPERENVEVKF